jgi:hypothetical protein
MDSLSSANTICVDELSDGSVFGAEHARAALNQWTLRTMQPGLPQYVGSNRSTRVVRQRGGLVVPQHMMVRSHHPRLRRMLRLSHSLERILAAALKTRVRKDTDMTQVQRTFGAVVLLSALLLGTWGYAHASVPPA